ncbi:MAG TPA: type II toxin-antitoxin system Phd/YefM family antitoxin [Polyangiaceae bacterium]|nr:type II toxin-antitoxin system Phd/YefM family antitoxin [Polyangiaceae bacterium]
MKVSVADAKNHLPKLIHDAEKEPVEILRRGELVAAIVSRELYLRMPKGDCHAAVMSWREKYKDDLESEAWLPARDEDPSGGRNFSWE